MIKFQLDKAFLLSVVITTSTVSIAGSMGVVQADENRFFFNVAPIYGAVSDEGINKLLFVDTMSQDGAIVGKYTDFDSKWGYSLGLGYRFGPEKHHDLELTYTNLKNKGSNAAAVSGEGILVNRLSQIAQQTDQLLNVPPIFKAGGIQLKNANSNMSSQIQFQTANLITHRNFQSIFVNHINFSRYFGIKATELKKGFLAQYSGQMVDRTGSGTLYPLTDLINYQAKFFGIGPRFGMGAGWDLNRHFSINGDVSASVLGGSYNTSWNESLTTTGAIPNLLPSNNYTYNQVSPTTLWTSIVIGSNLSLSGHFDVNNGAIVDVQAGINTEQYWSEIGVDAIRSAETRNQIYISQRFGVRDLFLKLSYFC